MTIRRLAPLVLVVALGCAKRSEQIEPAQPAPAQASTASDFIFYEAPAKASSLRSLLDAQIAIANTKKLTLVVYAGATWCPACQAIQKSLNAPLMRDAFRGLYIVHFDVDVWGEELAREGFASSSIPAFFKVAPLGKPGKVITGAAWGKDVPENMAPPLKRFFAAG